MVRTSLIAMLALIASAGPLDAQRMRPGERPQGDRPALERRFRERLESVMRQRLGLTDEQARKLQDANTRFEGRRRELFAEERRVRMGLRRALDGDSSTASNEEVATLLDRAMKLQRERLDLMESEQKELATFMTPIQRAKYFGLLEQVRRQMDDMRNQRNRGDKDRPSLRPHRPPPPG